MAAGTVAAAVAMVPSYLTPSIVSAPVLLVPMLAVPVVLTEGGDFLLTSGPSVKVDPSIRVVDVAIPAYKVAAAVPACKFVIVVVDTSPLIVSDAMPLVAATVPVRVTMIVVLVDGVALWLLVV